MSYLIQTTRRERPKGSKNKKGCGTGGNMYHSIYVSKLPGQDILTGSNRLIATNAGANNISSTVGGSNEAGNGTGSRATGPMINNIGIEEERRRQSK